MIEEILLVPTDNTRPTNEIVALLKDEYGKADLANKDDPLEELIFIMLTVRTSYKQYYRIWENFRANFTNWEQVISSNIEKIADAIFFGGMQKQKAERIYKVLRYLMQKTGRLNLANLYQLSDEESEKFLLELPGVGKKISRCVMLFSLHRNVLPVDSNIFRVAERVGLIDPADGRSKNEEYLQSITPEDIRREFHVCVISLGREICTSRTPKCSVCPLKGMCNYGRGLKKLSLAS